MKTETKIAEGYVDYLNERSKRYGGHKNTYILNRMEMHKESCQRFLEFLDALNIGNAVNQMFKRDDKVTFKYIKQKITDLKNAIKIYNKNGI